MQSFSKAIGRERLPGNIAALRIDVDERPTPESQSTRRLSILHTAGPVPLDSPVVSAALPPRLQREDLAVEAYDWEPTITQSGGPTPNLSPELGYLQTHSFWSGDHRQPEGMLFVRQSEGCVSSNLPLVSAGFVQCSMLLFRNEKGETLMFHHDSTARSGWGDSYAHLGGTPTSPSTPTRGLMMRRSPLKDFIEKAARVRMVMVESERGCDRRELYDLYRSKGVEVLPPIQLATRHHGGKGDRAVWNGAYRPGTDELMVHMKDGADVRVMHWQGVLSPAEDGSWPVPLLRRVPFDEGDLVDRLPIYRAVLADPNFKLTDSEATALRLCVECVELRNEAPQEAAERLMLLFKRRLVPQHVRELLAKLDLHERGSHAMKGLAEIAEFAGVGMSWAYQEPSSDSDGYPDLASDSESADSATGDSDSDSDSDTDSDVGYGPGRRSAPLPTQQTAEHPAHDLAPDAAADGAHG